MAMESTKNSEEYISLFEAAKFCPYSEPYLRLRARQGKLKSIKIDKKWMTTKGWINDYILQSKAWNEKIAANREKKSVEVKKSDNFEFLAPRAIAQPANTYSVPQIEFMSVPKPPALAIPKPPKSANYSSPQLLFVLGSSAMLALMLFMWMAADFKSAGSGIRAGQASLAAGLVQKQASTPSKDNFERQLDPQILEKSLARQAGQAAAAVDQSQIIAPVLDNNLFDAIQAGVSNLLKL